MSAAPDITDVDRQFLEEAVEHARQNVLNGGGPFGAVIVEHGEVVARAANRVTQDNDPTAHAEVLAIRAACLIRGDFQLRGMTLYSSCEPCPMCLATALWARVDRVLFAGDRHDAARGGFDDLAFYELFATPREQWETPVLEVRTQNPAAPFDEWLNSTTRIDY
ncbi:MAG: nucleoside deaminase [Ornithinimicrobium sp.]